MLAQLTPEEFDERLAHYQLNPWDGQLFVGSLIAATIRDVFAQFCYFKAGKAMPRSAHVSPADVVERPAWIEAAERKAAEEVAAGESPTAEQMARALGCL